MNYPDHSTRQLTLAFNSRKGTEALRQSLQEAGCRLLENCWAESLLEAGKPDGIVLDFYEAVRNLPRAYRLSRWARRNGVRVIALDRDAPWHRGVKAWRLKLFGLLGLADICATHSLQSAGRFTPETIYFPNAARVPDYSLAGRTLQELRNPEHYLYDVSFIGNLNAARYPEHARRAQFIDSLRPLLEANGIRYRFIDSEGVSVSQQVELIQVSKINLNYGAACDNRGEKSWGLPERCYGVPACGGFLLSDRREHAGRDFDLRSEWADFTDLEDCLEKIRYYLANFALSRNIAEAAYARTIKDHTYGNRAQQLIHLFRNKSAVS